MPYRKKSYHSMVVPMVAASAARVSILRCSAADMAGAWAVDDMAFLLSGFPPTMLPARAFRKRGAVRRSTRAAAQMAETWTRCQAVLR